MQSAYGKAPASIGCGGFYRLRRPPGGKLFGGAPALPCSASTTRAAIRMLPTKVWNESDWKKPHQVVGLFVRTTSRISFRAEVGVSRLSYESHRTYGTHRTKREMPTYTSASKTPCPFRVLVGKFYGFLRRRRGSGRFHRV